MRKKKKPRPQSRSNQAISSPVFTCEAEILPGLKPFAQAELQGQLGKNATLLPTKRTDQIHFHYQGNLKNLLQLRKVVAIYLLQHFAIPRPRALLGHQNLQSIIALINLILAMYPRSVFRTFRFSAAGKNSSVFTRLKDEIQAHTTLEYTETEAELFIRIRPGRSKRDGWEVLIRISPRPLSVRPWRVSNMSGALNATIAAAMIELTAPKSRDRFLNLMSGSGTLLIERLARCPAQIVVGGELSSGALAKARQNIRSANLSHRILLTNLDVSHPPFLEAQFDVICADLPWGQLVGSHMQNADLYPKVLIKTAYLAAPQARFVLLTHQIKLFERVLQDHTDLWQIQKRVQVYQGGLHPKIYLLQRSPFLQ